MIVQGRGPGGGVNRFNKVTVQHEELRRLLVPLPECVMLWSKYTTRVVCKPRQIGGLT